jgi:hypothetical protein
MGYGKNTIKMDCRQAVLLPCLEFLDCSAAFLEEDTVTTVGTPDVHVNLYLQFAPGALV